MAQFTLGGGMGMPPGMAQLLQEKYRQSGQQVNAQTTQANAAATQAAAQAKLDTQRAAVVQPLAQSSIATDKANNNLTNVNAAWLPAKYNADIKNTNANTNLTNTQNQWYGPKAQAEIALAGSQGRNLDSDALSALRNANDELQPPAGIPSASARILGDMQGGGGMTAKPLPLLASGGVFGGGGDTGAPAPINVMAPSVSPLAPKRGTPSLLDSPSFLELSKPKYASDPFGFKFKRGVTSVPGKGSGDKVPAALEPKEAVLNKHAADMLGRKKIAQLNKAGNEKRAKQDTQRVSKLAQALKQMGMV